MPDFRLTRRAALAAAGALAMSPHPARRALADAEPRRGGVLSVHVSSEQRILNPALRASSGVYIIAAKIMEPLIDLDAAGKPDPMLATAWESTADGKTIMFRLRPGVSWHDGKPFTSADVQFTAMEMWKKHLNYGSTLQRYLDAVDTPDPHTAIFRYARPMPLDLLLRALPDLGYVAPRHVFEGTNVLENPANTAPIGTGPFRFVRYERGQYVIAERNPDYWKGGQPYLDRIVWRFITDPAAAAAALESGQLQMSNYSSLALADMDRLKKDPRFVVSTKGNEGNAVENTIEFNCRRRELSDLRVRRAIIHALDIDFFCENFLYGFGKRAQGPIPTSSPAFFAPGAPDYPFDRAKAEALLDQAGYRRGADGTRFVLRVVNAPWAEDITLWSTFIQQSLQQIGIKVEIVRFDAAGFLTTVYRDWNYDIATGWHQYRNDPAVSTTVWYRSGSPKGSPWTNQWGWQSDAVDRLIDDAASELDAGRRRQKYAEFVRLVNVEVPIFMAIERQFVSVTSTRLQNSHNNPRWPSSHWSDAWMLA
jgi:peptide/nickel transport system substrate-binding protein